MYENGEKPSAYTLVKKLNSIKRNDFPWMSDVTKQSPQYAIHDLERGFKAFFRRQNGYPKFKKKGIKDSFAIREGKIIIEDKRIHVPRIGKVKMAEHLRFDGTPKQFTIKREADRWLACVAIELANPRVMPKAKAKRVGIDVGVREFAFSDGTKAEVPRAYRNMERRISRAQRELSRKCKGSNNRRKAKMRVAKLHMKARNIRDWWLHDLTTRLVRDYEVVAVEDLNVSGMVRNHHLAKSISDAGFYAFRSMLEYKCAEYGRELVIAPRFMPSSKTCSHCGFKIDILPLNIREWVCPECGVIHDRDVNAAINLENYAVKSTVSACGEFLPLGTSAKQENAFVAIGGV
jgi:putative transposase